MTRHKYIRARELGKKVSRRASPYWKYAKEKYIERLQKDKNFWIEQFRQRSLYYPVKDRTLQWMGNKVIKVSQELQRQERHEYE